ncbi:MAG: hypothetical protein JOS17DRAFT_586066 [Linnemannia elongata]|nr:MAG: hypothetical protein JOS17DRAFT_586066 [Linnemannia elongata]
MGLLARSFLFFLPAPSLPFFPSFCPPSPFTAILVLALPCVYSFQPGPFLFRFSSTHPTLIFPPSLSLPSLSLLHHNLFLILHPIILSLIHNPILISSTANHQPIISIPIPILITHLFSLSLSLPHSLTLTL